MNSRLRFVVLALLAATVFLSSPASALEKTVGRLTDGLDGWRSGGTSTNCLVDYYNTCNGWIWIWSGWAPEDQIGVCFTSCCTGLGANVDSSFVFFSSGAPSGYGFTGSVGIFNVDGDCCPTGSPISSQPLLPTSTAGIDIIFPLTPVSSNFAVDVHVWHRRGQHRSRSRRTTPPRARLARKRAGPATRARVTAARSTGER